MTLVKKLSLRIKFALGSLFYLSYAPKAFRYSRWKEKVERQTDIPFRPKNSVLPGKLLRTEKVESSIHFYFEQAELEVCFLTSDLVQMNWKPGLLPVPCAIARQNWPPIEIQLEETADG
jgi:alpha-glucosidase